MTEKKDTDEVADLVDAKDPDAKPKEVAETAVKKAALLLAERTKPDPTSRLLFLLTAGLLVFLSLWWMAHDGPPKDAPPAPTAPVPTVEYPK